MARPPLPPFTAETARAKVQSAEDAWNTRDPERVALAYTEDSLWRNRDRFVTGRAEIVEFLRQKWERELDYALRKELWAYTGNRIAVRFQYECHDASGQWWRSYGNELWEFDEDGPDAPEGSQHQRPGYHRAGPSHPRPATGGRARHCLRSCLTRRRPPAARSMSGEGVAMTATTLGVDPADSVTSVAAGVSAARPYADPGAGEVVDACTGLARLAIGDLTGAATLLGPLGFVVTSDVDPAAGRPYAMAVSETTTERAWGLYSG